VALTWYARQGDKPLVPSRNHVSDHIGLSVTDLDAWIAKPRGGRRVPGATLPAGRHPRRDDRGSKPRSHRVGRGEVAASSIVSAKPATFSVRSCGCGNPYVDGPLFARAEQRADRIDCDHMSGLLMAVHMTACQDGGPRREFQTVLRLRVVPLGSTECLASGID
jgi:hypothetical protein